MKKEGAHFAGIGSFMGNKKSDFEMINIGTDKLVFICSPNNELLKSGKQKIEFEELIKFPFITREKGSGTRDVFEQQFPEYIKLNNQLVINDNDSIITAVNDSNYISVLSEIIAEKAEKAGLIKILQIKEYPVIAKRGVFFVKLKKKVTKLKEDFWNEIRTN